jgi:hypothetical protein
MSLAHKKNLSIKNQEIEEKEKININGEIMRQQSKGGENAKGNVFKNKIFLVITPDDFKKQIDADGSKTEGH